MQRPAAARKPTEGASRGRNPAGAVLRVAAGAVAGSLRLAAQRPAVVLAGIAVIGGAGIFAWNATMKQTVRHPAPLFAGPKPVAAKQEPPQKRAEAASPTTTGTTRPDIPTPPPRPSGPDAIGSIIRASEGPARTAEAKPRSAEAKPKAAEARSPETKSPEAKPAPAAEAKPAPQPRVASAQKALVKLGYGPIAADGLLGSNTRLALEKFERDKKLPVTGGLGPRTVKQLASLSGISIQ